MTTDRNLITEGRAVDHGATPAPWYVCLNDLIGGYCIQTVDKPASETELPGRSVADMVISDADANHIVWMRNNLPTLLDELEAIVQVRDRYSAAYAVTTTDLGNARRWAEWFAAERDYLRREVAKDYAAIAEKQRRDNARIAELEATQQEPAGYVVGRKTPIGWGFAAAYGGPELTRAGAEQELAGAIEDDGPEFGWRLLEVREVQP